MGEKAHRRGQVLGKPEGLSLIKGNERPCFSLFGLSCALAGHKATAA
jgi:hypothetical protein